MTVHSMTAFARESLSEPAALTIELRSVNQRYLDCHFKLPDTLRSLEPQLREAIAGSLKRGKIDCQIRLLGDAGTQGLSLDPQRLDQLAALVAQVDAALPGLPRPDPLTVLGFPGICDGRSLDEDSLQRATLEAFRRALATLVESRAREGAQLAGFLDQRLDALSAIVTAVRRELPQLRERQQERLRRRLEELGVELDQARLEQELVYLAQKSDVDEELDRLEAHISEARRILERGGPCGRRLDFLMQEFNREANTLSSKATASSTTQNAVELKVLIEQMREQVQNVE